MDTPLLVLASILSETQISLWEESQVRIALYITIILLEKLWKANINWDIFCVYSFLINEIHFITDFIQEKP